MTRRFAGVVAVALVLFVAALPAAAACCIGKPNAPAAASMHASMPCCAETCNLTGPNTNRDRDIALSATPSPVQPLRFVADVAAAVSEPIERGFQQSTERASHEFCAPPPFLLHSQFRI